MLITVPQVVNNLDSNSPTAILSTLDLIDHEIGYCQEQASGFIQLARWYDKQAAARIEQRRALAADVDTALAEADRLLR